MPKLEAGKWPPYNVEALDQNIARVFFEEDIQKLNKPTYQFIIAHMGFIAHYDLRGFQGEYQDLDHFRTMLQTSEYSIDPNYNLQQAQRFESDRDFDRWYGQAHCHSVAAGIRRIVKQARARTVRLFVAHHTLSQIVTTR